MPKRTSGKLHCGIIPNKKDFTAQVRQKIDFIRQNPQAVAIRYADVRTAVIDIFPFMIHYTIEDDKKLVLISAIFHTSLDPEQWKNR